MSLRVYDRFKLRMQTHGAAIQYLIVFQNFTMNTFKFNISATRILQRTMA